ncbi:transposase [Nonomuraea sp. NPDC046570]|uniref:transposase n=1 Tax=Nonomuraea sp. NPDC046570 TaxID=3155255 RepID=UPI0033E8F66C
MAGVVAYRDGERPHLFYKPHIYRGRKGEPKTFSWIDYRDLIVATHQHLNAPLIWCWDNLSVHLAEQLADFDAEQVDWLRIVQLPAYAPELNPVEGIWSLLRRAMANFVVADLPGVVRVSTEAVALHPAWAEKAGIITLADKAYQRCEGPGPHALRG